MVVGSEMSDCLEEMIHGLRNERDQARVGDFDGRFYSF